MSTMISGDRQGERQRWRCCSASEASWLVEEVEGDVAELVGTLGCHGDDGGCGYGGKTTTAASTGRWGESQRGREATGRVGRK